jgi:alpha,alpha-trehalase
MAESIIKRREKPMNGWILTYKDYVPKQEGLRETLCATGNGYFVTRGATADTSSDDTHYPGTYLAGCYNRAVSTVVGKEIENEDLVNLPNWLSLTFRIEEGDWFQLQQVNILNYVLQLHLKSGLLERSIRFEDSLGRITRWHEKRFVSMADRHVGALWVELHAENWSGTLSVRSGIDGRIVNKGVKRYRGLTCDHLEALESTQVADNAVVLTMRTKQSRIEISESARTTLYQKAIPVRAVVAVEQLPDGIYQNFSVALEPGNSVQIEKIVAIFSSKDPALSNVHTEAIKKIGRVADFQTLYAEHERAWSHLWDEYDIVVHAPNEEDANLKIRLHLFHLLQTVSTHSVDCDAGVPARGWHGEAYRGHVFWDELFILPFLNLSNPILTRALLKYRYRRLPEARAAAREAGLKGALFPWQSGSDGREESQKMHLNPNSGRWIPDNSYRQRHINAAIAFNVWRYFEVTEDFEFLHDYGAELFFEIARLWASLATYNAPLDRYEIHGVMGPDEYHEAYPGVDPETQGGLSNNAYTNVMVAWILSHTRDIFDLLPEERCCKLCETLNLDSAEFERWDEISKKLRIPFQNKDIISQFEHYEQLQEFDWQGYRAKYGDIQRLDRLLEAEGDSANRYKASKQADVLMLFYLFSVDELKYLFDRLGYRFEKDMIRRNINYYLQRTSHGSTLSWIVHSWVLARTDRPQAWPLFMQALNSDVQDIQGGTTAEGIHLGAMAGTIDLIQRGFTGIEARGDVLYFNPSLPKTLTLLKMRVRYRRHLLSIEINQEHLKVHSHRTVAAPIMIAYRGHYRRMVPHDTYTFRLVPARPHRKNGSSHKHLNLEIETVE